MEEKVSLLISNQPLTANDSIALAKLQEYFKDKKRTGYEKVDNQT
jgi:hypothetical protein